MHYLEQHEAENVKLLFFPSSDDSFDVFIPRHQCQQEKQAFMIKILQANQSFFMLGVITHFSFHFRVFDVKWRVRKMRKE